MAGTTARIDDALKRVLALSGAEAERPEALSGPRLDIVEALRRSPEPMSVADLAAAVRVHANTARHHLDVLSAAGLVDRATEAPDGRGRPRTLYSISASASAPFQELSDVLTTAVAADGRDAVVEAVASRWLRTVPDHRDASTTDAAVDVLVEALRSVGFEARRDPVGDSVVIDHCPYASLIAEHPLICTVHAELVSQVLEETGQPVSLDALDVWVRPGVCRARLTRADVTPEFTASPRRSRQ